MRRFIPLFPLLLLAIPSLAQINNGGGGSGGSGTVTSFSAGDLAPIFTSNVATATTTPAHTFTLTNAAANTAFGNFTGAGAAPSYTVTTGTGSPVAATNPSFAGLILGSGQILVPSTTCTTPSYSETGQLTVGIAMNSTTITFCPTGLVAGIKSTGYIGVSNSVLGWSASTANITAFASGISPTSTTVGGVLSVGNGSTQDETGFIRSAAPCRITAAVALTVGGGSTTICSWSLKGIALTWGWQCSGTYNVSAGTTPTFGLGMNASQTPTSETGNASIGTTLSGTSTQGSTTATASGNQSILTGGTLTTVTNAPWTSSGTIQASATAGTFAITGIVTGTTAVGQVNVGSTCFLY